MNFKLINRVIGFGVFLFATVVYVMTVQPTMSFWDCGEFLACAFTVGIPHPPGAPLHILVGKIFTLLPFASDVGLRMNYLSVIASSFSVLLLYIISVKLIKNWFGEPKNSFEGVLITAASAIGALSYAFCDSFWFNAMEAEVYGFGTFLIALCIYLMILWWEKADEVGSDNYLLLIAYIVGLSIGIHLLVVQCIFIAGLIFYFRRYKYAPLSLLIAVGVSMISFFIVYPLIVKKFPEAISSNPMLGGIIVIAILISGIVYAIKKGSSVLKLLFLSLFLIVLGYSTYISTLQRASISNLPINQTRPDNMERMLSYLNREQYGEQPLILPRRYSHDPMHNNTWKNYSSDMEFMWKYQINHMFNRYLFWQYIGRESYNQDSGVDFSKFYAIPFILGLIGIFYHFRKDWKLAFVFLVTFIMMGVVTALYQNQQDPQPRERDYFYEGAFFVYSLWIGIGVFGICELVKDKVKKSSMVPLTSAILLVSFIFVPVNMLRINYHNQDRSQNVFPFDYAYNLLQSVDKDAILITNGDNDTFPLWCLQAVYGIRRDVRVVNLSLGQIDWYILQLKNERPYGALTVPMTMSDEQVKKLAAAQIQLWDETKLVTLDVPESAYPDTLKDKPGKIVFKIPATFKQSDGKQNYTGLKVNDLLVFDIVRANKFERPIYFSITVSPEYFIGLNEYLQLEGMAQKLVPYKSSDPRGINLNLEKMKANLLADNVSISATPQSGFIFRSANKGIFFEQVQFRMLDMYRTLYVWLANTYLQDSTKTNMVASTLERMEKNVPVKDVPMDYRMKYDIAMIYYKMSDMKKFDEYAREAYNEAYTDRKNYVRNPQSKFNPYSILLDICEARGDYKTSLELLKELPQNDPSVKLKIERINSILSGSQKNQ
jgi:hypothetical protein